MEQRELVSRIVNKVFRWLELPPGRSQIKELRDDLLLLEYLQADVELWQPGSPELTSPICSVQGCLADWHQGLVNHAHQLNDPVWFCQQHLPELSRDRVRPPGFHELEGPLLVKAKEMKGKWEQVIRWLQPSAAANSQEPASTIPVPTPAPASPAIQYTKDKT